MPFPNYLRPLFQSESWCSSFHMKISFHSRAKKTNLHLKGWAPGLAFKKRPKVIRKWPIITEPMHVVHETAKLVISRRENFKNEKVCEMFKHEKCTCKACETIVFHCQICKFVQFLLTSSSWLLQLPNGKRWFVAALSSIGYLRSYDGNCNENVTLKLNLALS